MQRRTYLTTLGLATGVVLSGCSDTGTNNSSNGGGGTGSGGQGEGSTETPTSGGGEAGASTPTEGGETTATSTGGESNETTDSDTETEGSANTESSSSSSDGGFGPETYSGSGTATEEGLDLTMGPITAEYSHSGSGNFIVNLITLEGESYQDVLLANIIGQAEGAQVGTASANGGYNLDVQADGDWEITLEQPSNPQPQSLPFDESGEGPSYIGPYDFSGPTAIQGSHDGESNFIVTPVPVDPSDFGISVFNEIGQFEGSTTARIEGVSYLKIEADGAWTLSTQE